jgi:predicted DNA binding CopG/RHH family protein
MRDNYDVSKLNPRKNPYAEKLKRQVTINLKSTTVDYFKKLAEETGIPYHNLIDLYLDDCVKKGNQARYKMATTGINLLLFLRCF